MGEPPCATTPSAKRPSTTPTSSARSAYTTSMRTLPSYLCGAWAEGKGDLQTLVNPATEEPLARAGAGGLDRKAALEHARSKGGPGLRALTFAERGALLQAMGDALQTHRNELLDLSVTSGRNTRGDAKPATPSALLAHRMLEILVEKAGLPEGALSLLVGGVGDLLEHLGPQDVVAFTGSSETGRKIRALPSVIRHSVRVNVEADSLNAAVMGPDAAP